MATSFRARTLAETVEVKPGFTLGRLGLDRRFPGKQDYEKALERAQIAMLEVEQAFRVGGRRGIVLFEGWDGGGKGGAIQRLTARLDPRWVSVWAIGKPAPAEQGRHYLWRFWQRLPPPGHLAIFDRSWYGRVLVERVDKLIVQADWERAYREINEFERMLIDDGIRLVKIFLHVSAEEQLRRLAERIADPIKHWKIEAADIHNYADHDAYIAAADEMFAQTSTDRAPWHAIPGEHKWFARVAAIETAVTVLGRGLDLKPPPVDKAVGRAAREMLKKADFATLGFGKNTRSKVG